MVATAAILIDLNVERKLRASLKEEVRAKGRYKVSVRLAR